MTITRWTGALALEILVAPATAQAPLATYAVPDRMQKLLYERDFVPTHKKIETKLNKMPLVFAT